MKMLSRIALVVAILACVGAMYFAKQLGATRDGLTADKKQLTDDKTRLTKDLDTTRNDLTVLRQKLTKVTDDFNNTTASLRNAELEAAQKKQEAEALKQTVADKARDLEQAKAELSTAQDKIKQVEQVIQSDDFKNIDDIRKKIATQADEIKILGEQLVAKKTEVAGLEEKVKELSITPSNLRGKVAAVEDKWGFVVIDVGRDQRVHTNVNFLVFRDSKLVSKVQVQKIGQNTSVAEVLPEFQRASMPRVGDQVVH